VGVYISGRLYQWAFISVGVYMRAYTLPSYGIVFMIKNFYYF